MGDVVSLWPADAEHEKLADAQHEKLVDVGHEIPRAWDDPPGPDHESRKRLDGAGEGCSGPWASGTARCIACHHEWVAAAPSDVADLQCPECGVERGQFKWPFTLAKGQPFRQCHCGGNLFHLAVDATPEQCDQLNSSGSAGFDHYLMCAGCGKTQTF